MGDVKGFLKLKGNLAVTGRFANVSKIFMKSVCCVTKKARGSRPPGVWIAARPFATGVVP